MFKSEWIQFVKGDRSAFHKVYEAHIDDLFSFGMSICNNRSMVLDCIHDLFVDLFDNPRIAQEVNVKFYLFSALRRRILKVKKHNVLWTDFDAHRLDVENSLVLTGSTEDEIIQSETAESIRKTLLNSLDKLPARQREIVHLRYYMGFSYEEISQIMNVNVGTCRTLSYRAVKLLKHHLPTVGQLIFYLLLIK